MDEPGDDKWVSVGDALALRLFAPLAPLRDIISREDAKVRQGATKNVYHAALRPAVIPDLSFYYRQVADTSATGVINCVDYSSARRSLSGLTCTKCFFVGLVEHLHFNFGNFIETKYRICSPIDTRDKFIIELNLLTDSQDFRLDNYSFSLIFYAININNFTCIYRRPHFFYPYSR